MPDQVTTPNPTVDQATAAVEQLPQHVTAAAADAGATVAGHVHDRAVPHEVSPAALVVESTVPAGEHAAVGADSTAPASGHEDAHTVADAAHGHSGFHFNFDAVREHHTMPFPAIEWMHGSPRIIFNLSDYAGRHISILEHDANFVQADAAPYLSWANETAQSYGVAPEHLAKAMAVADAKDWYTFPQSVSFFNNQTFIGTIALLLMTVILIVKRPRAGQVKPQGAVQHMLEAMVQFVRDDVVRPNVKGLPAHGHGHGHESHGHGHGHESYSHGHDDHGHGAAVKVSPFAYADRWVPHFAALFLAILAFNLVGLIPGGGSSSGNPGVTVAFALTTLLTMLLFGIKEQGIVRYFINLVPVHWSWSPIDMVVWFLLLVIELMGLIIKPAALAIRLAANMFAGHTALLAFTTLGFIIYSSDPSQGALSLGLGVVGWVIAVALYFLELLVAFIQAYIFTLLSAIFIGSSIHPEH